MLTHAAGSDTAVSFVHGLALLCLAQAGTACNSQPAAAPTPPALPHKAAPPVVAPVASTHDAAKNTCDPDGRCWNARSVVNKGLLCVSNHKTSAIHVQFETKAGHLKEKLRPGATPFVLIDGAPCLSTSCTRASKHECTLTEHQGELEVTTHYSYEESTQGPCTEDCQRVTAACRLPPLAAGTHTIRFGDQRLTLEVPGPLRGDCIERL